MRLAGLFSAIGRLDLPEINADLPRAAADLGGVPALGGLRGLGTAGLGCGPWASPGRAATVSRAFHVKRFTELHDVSCETVSRCRKWPFKRVCVRARYFIRVKINRVKTAFAGVIRDVVIFDCFRRTLQPVRARCLRACAGAVGRFTPPCLVLYSPRALERLRAVCGRLRRPGLYSFTPVPSELQQDIKNPARGRVC